MDWQTTMTKHKLSNKPVLYLPGIYVVVARETNLLWAKHETTGEITSFALPHKFIEKYHYVPTKIRVAWEESHD